MLNAQDIIVMKNGNALAVKVAGLTSKAIKYRSIANPSDEIHQIPFGEVKTLIYQNGQKLSFDDEQDTEDVYTETPDQLSSDSADSSQTQKGSSSYDTTNESVNDAILINKHALSIKNASYSKRAKWYRIIGWTGGILIAGIGTYIGYTEYIGDGHHEYKTIVPVSIGVGAIWCVGFNLLANRQMSIYRQNLVYGTPLIEKEIIRHGKNNLSAGIDALNTTTDHMSSLGIGIRYNF